MKLSILYFSRSGHTESMAEAVMEGMKKVEGIEVKAFNVEKEIDEEWVKESKGIVLGSPTYTASVPGDMVAWLQKKFSPLGVAGKLGGTFSMARYPHGGGELVMRTIQDHMMVYGMMIYSGGGSFGAPVIHLGPMGIDDYMDDFRENFVIFGERFAGKAKELFD